MGGGGGFLQDTWGFCELREEPPGSWNKKEKKKKSVKLCLPLPSLESGESARPSSLLQPELDTNQTGTSAAPAGERFLFLCKNNPPTLSSLQHPIATCKTTQPSQCETWIV